MAYSKFSRKFENDFFIMPHQISRKFIPMKFSDRLRIGILGIYSEILRKFWDPIISWKFGGIGNIW